MRKFIARTIIMAVAVPVAAATARWAADRLERRHGETALTRGLRYAGRRGRSG
jgi:hypothetical protein